MGQSHVLIPYKIVGFATTQIRDETYVWYSAVGRFCP